jgi:hypothetical protein
MIILNPNKYVRQKFKNIDYQILSSIFSTLFDVVDTRAKKRHHHVDIYFSSKKSDSHYTFKKPTTAIYISKSIKTEKKFISTLIHEFRHLIQDKIFKIPFSRAYYDDSTIANYFKSPIEVDARAYELMITPYVMRMHSRLKKLKKTFKEHSGFFGTTLY